MNNTRSIGNLIINGKCLDVINNELKFNVCNNPVIPSLDDSQAFVINPSGTKYQLINPSQSNPGCIYSEDIGNSMKRYFLKKSNCDPLLNNLSIVQNEMITNDEHIIINTNSSKDPNDAIGYEYNLFSSANDKNAKTKSSKVYFLNAGFLQNQQVLSEALNAIQLPKYFWNVTNEDYPSYQEILNDTIPVENINNNINDNTVAEENYSSEVLKSKNKKSHSNIGLIIGIVVGAVFLLIFGGLGYFYLLRTKNNLPRTKIPMKTRFPKSIMIKI